MVKDYSKIIKNELFLNKLSKLNGSGSAISNKIEALLKSAITFYDLADIDINQLIEKAKTIEGIDRSFESINNYEKVCNVIDEYSDTKQQLIIESMCSDFLNNITQLEITENDVTFNTIAQPGEIGVGRDIYKKMLLSDTTPKHVNTMHTPEIISSMRAHTLDIMSFTNECLSHDICGNIIREVVDCIHYKCETTTMTFNINAALMNESPTGSCDELIGNMYKTMNKIKTNLLYGDFYIIASPDVVGVMSHSKIYKPMYHGFNNVAMQSVAPCGTINGAKIYRDIYATTSYYTVIARANDNKYQPLAVHIRDISTNLIDENDNVKYFVSYTVNIYANELPYIAERCMISKE